jgi:superfamily I DNA and/or RNA helicase/very-short-patch-repair endonuclease
VNELENCVILFDKELGEYKDKSHKIQKIIKDEKSRKYFITFNGGNTYNYNFSSVTWLTSPTEVDIKNKLIYLHGKALLGVKRILKFGDWYKVIIGDKIITYKKTELQIVEDCANNSNVHNLIEYLKNALRIVGDDCNQKNFLLSEIETMTVSEQSILAKLLLTDTINETRFNGDIIFPFQTNEAQILAVENALRYDISVIQGPPGTGKTQTILNIISNFLIRDMKIAVVSGSNEATRNVEEKLLKENLGGLDAFLGKTDNQKVFFSKEHDLADLISRLHTDETVNSEAFKDVADRALKIYKYRIDCAKLKQRIEELQIEQKINDEEYKLKGHKLPRKFIKRTPTAEDCLKISAVLESLSAKKKINLIDKLKLRISFRLCDIKGIIKNISDVIDYMQNTYYRVKIAELKSEFEEKSQFLKNNDSDELLKTYQRYSSIYLRRYLERHFKLVPQSKFTIQNYKQDFSAFTDRFPIIYSTTYAIRCCSGENYLYDAVIMDESGQVNLASAIVAMSCAKRIIFVGDLKQLAHVVKSAHVVPLDKLFNQYRLPSYFDYSKNSILKCVQEKYKNKLPNILLNEHYRCDPQIIDFCNKRFYNNQLIIQTKHKEGNGITIITTEPNFAIGRTNERQVDIIIKEILPQLQTTDIGIVAPYCAQVELLKDKIQNPNIFIETVHKFQGKECSVIIMSTVSNRVKFYEDEEKFDFLNSDNLINVAISRAKDKLYLVTSKEILEQEGSLLKDFSRYISYYCKDSVITATKIYSVFDLMYDEYSPILKEMKERLLHVSAFESENIIATILKDIFQSKKYENFAYKIHYPLRKIIKTDLIEDIEDKNFAENVNTHCDFLIFNTLDKSIQLIIEVDGSQHNGEIQRRRDERKDRLLNDFGINVLRLKTTDSDTISECKEKIISQLKKVHN